MNILLVEDEVGIVNFLKQGLEEEDYVIDIAQDGKLGLKLALSQKYDLLILDWMLPELTGIELCIEFRKNNQTTPIIFLTAKDTIDETITGLQAGANDYLKKPFSFDELLARVEVQLRNNSKRTNILTFDNLKLDKEARLVTKNGEDLSFTKKEFDLLALLIENKNKVCKREDIIKKVWDIHFEYDTSVIDVYINAIRKKLNLKVDDNCIITVRGIGYIMKEQ